MAFDIFGRNFTDKVGNQPNFAALNRGRHLYSAGRPSRWALAHISSLTIYERLNTTQQPKTSIT